MSEERAASEELTLISPKYAAILLTLLRNWRAIAAAALVCAVAAAALVMMMPVTFESEATLLLFPPPFKQTGDDMSALIPRVLSVPDYEILLHSDGTLMKAVEKVRALGTWPEDDLESLEALSELRKRMEIEIEVVEKTAYGVSHSPVIVLKAQAGTPEQARDLAQAWAEVSEELAEDLYRKGKTGLRDFIGERYDSAREELTNVNEMVRDIEIEWNDELERARMQNKHSRLLAYEEKLTDLRMQIASTRAELAEIQENFSEEPEKKVLWKSPPMTALFLRDTKAGLAPPGGGAEGNEQEGYRDEVLNQTYIYLKEKLYLKQTELQSMLEHESQLVAQMDGLDQELQALREEAAQRTFERKQVMLQETALKHSHELLAAKLEQAKIAESEQENLNDIKIVSNAVLPDKKVWPPRTLVVLAAGFFGLIAGTAAVLLRAGIASLRTRGASAPA